MAFASLVLRSVSKVVEGIKTHMVQEKEVAEGQTVEISQNYFAISKRTTDGFYFGEDVDTYKNGSVGHQTEEPADSFQRYLPSGCFASVETDELKKQSQMSAMSLPGAFGQTAIVTQMFDHVPDDPVGRMWHLSSSRLQTLALF